MDIISNSEPITNMVTVYGYDKAGKLISEKVELKGNQIVETKLRWPPIKAIVPRVSNSGVIR